MAWLPDGFETPQRVELASGHHLRPLREADVAIDYPAVMGSRERLWARYGAVWGWPSPSMSYEADREALARHEAETAAGEAFNYAVLNLEETLLFGCIYIDPPAAASPPGSEAVASWWVSEIALGTALEQVLDDFVPGWLSDTWDFKAVDYEPRTQSA